MSVPPRHGKSDTVLHFIAWLLLRTPTARILYVTHTKSFALKQSKTARKLARAAGVRLSDESNRGDEWETEAGGGLVSRGIDGEITGRGFDVILVDDPVKSRKVAESALARENLFAWFTEDVFTRLTPTGSVIVIHTRWHVDDLIGRLVKDKGYKRLNIRAIAVVGNDNGQPENDNWKDPREDGEALWPEGGWTVEVLQERRALVGEYGWWSLYQGEPRPRGGNVFKDAHFYDELPSKGYRVGLGVDLAYTAETQRRGDWSVILELWCEQSPNRDDLPVFYVVDVIRKQVEAPDFSLSLKAKATARPGVQMWWHSSGTEKGSLQFFKRAKIPIIPKNPGGDPFTRSQEFAAAWNDGRVLVPNPEAADDDGNILFPEAEHWLPTFLEELQEFTGIADKHDDQVVAGASAFDSLTHTMPGTYGAARKARSKLPKQTWD